MTFQRLVYLQIKVCYYLHTVMSNSYGAYMVHASVNIFEYLYAAFQ